MFHSHLNLHHSFSSIQTDRILDECFLERKQNNNEKSQFSHCTIDVLLLVWMHFGCEMMMFFFLLFYIKLEFSDSLNYFHRYISMSIDRTYNFRNVSTATAAAHCQYDGNWFHSMHNGSWFNDFMTITFRSIFSVLFCFLRLWIVHFVSSFRIE